MQLCGLSHTVNQTLVKHSLPSDFVGDCVLTHARASCCPRVDVGTWNMQSLSHQKQDSLLNLKVREILKG